MRTLHERLGGDPAIVAVVDELYRRLADDQRVQHFFDPERLDSLKHGQLRWFRSVLGGAPPDDRPDLAAAHAELIITDEHVDIVLGHLRASLESAGVPPDMLRQVMQLVTRLWLARQF